MKNKIHYSKESRRDMDEIWDYIITDLQNPIAATNVVDGIMDTIDQLEDFAESGAPLSSIANVETDYRFLASGNHLIFYRTSGNEVYVDRVLYGRRDFLRILFEETIS